MTKTFVGPVILIILGVVFLLNNLGILPWDIWFSLWKFWPVILVLVGVEILLGKNASIKTFAILIGLIFLVPIILSYNPLTNNPLATEEFKVEEGLGTATKAKINLNFPASNIKISALNSDSSFLIEGKITYSQAAKKPEIKKEEGLGEANLNLVQSIEGKLPFISNLKTNADLSLTRAIPLSILIKTGASTANLDLSQVRAEYLEINSGASNIVIKLAPDFNQKVLIKTGASSITLEIPEKLESAVVVDSQVKSVDVANRFEKKENRYETKGFDKALTRAEIEIKAAAGNIVIK